MRALSSTTVIAVEWTFLGLCLVVILARLYLRLCLQLQKAIPSDYLMCLAWLCGVWAAVNDIILKKLGWLNSESTWFDFPSDTSNAQLTQRLIFSSWFVLFAVQYLNKATLLSFFFTIFPSTLRYFTYSLWAVVIYSVLSFITSVLLVLIICLPSQSSGTNHSLCNIQSSLIIWITTWALHFSSDIFIFILPFSILHILRLGWKKKIALYITFGFGVFSIGACLARFLIVLLTYPSVPTTNLELWCALDIFTGLMVACLPSLRPYFNLI
ncbi:hypothetical protein BDV24DRAFT_110116 [Aspergillus arachidicola]|uniref:Rhodopsin domain-containing protein n=1 Tax=Aspergillus arachidicola TaxID=656916 RepID=A0A5N6XTX2_9EURO|nr:hypothetical protein BDV24DRAFT_110116 [Aspergillus arachidicola]